MLQETENSELLEVNTLNVYMTVNALIKSNKCYLSSKDLNNYKLAELSRHIRNERRNKSPSRPSTKRVSNKKLPTVYRTRS